MPPELLDEITSADPAVYWGLATAYPRFARRLTAGRRADWAVRFGFDVRVIVEPLMRVAMLCYTLGNETHRVGGPAMVGEDGSYVWYKKGAIHRVGQPAAEFYLVRGCWVIVWAENGKYHRMDGPAFYADNSVSGNHEYMWAIRGERMSEHWHAIFTM